MCEEKDTENFWGVSYTKGGMQWRGAERGVGREKLAGKT
jgi:hypothetical protein